MPSGKWFPAPKDGDSDGEQPDSFVSMSTVEDLSYTPSQDEKNRDAEQIAATGRRSWKTLKGRGEAVWPPMLEGALIEALKEYKKMEAPPTASKHGYRFPMRNRFVSDFIYTKTGKTRTAKQVGSRLQQLRDTCRDPGLATLLGRGPDQCKQERSPTPDHDSGSAAGSPAPSARPSPIIIYMQIEFPTQSSGPIDRVPHVPFERNDIQTPHFIYLLPAPQQVFSTDNRTSALSLYANLVDIVAHLPLQLDSVWTVYRHSTAVYSETSHIRPMASNSNAYRYSCELVPSSWSRLCQFPAEDLNDITIVQVLKPVPGAQAASSSLAGAIPMSASSPEGDISIVYHFNYPVTSRLGKSSKAMMLHHSPSPESPTSSSSPSPPAPGYSGSSGYEDQGMSQYSSGYWPAGSSNSPYHGHSAVSPLTPDNPISTTEGRSYGLYPQRVEGYESAEGYGGGRYELPDATMSSFYEEPRASSWMTPQPLMLPLTDGGRRESLAYGREDSYY